MLLSSLGGFAGLLFLRPLLCDGFYCLVTLSELTRNDKLCLNRFVYKTNQNIFNTGDSIFPFCSA